uniref:ER membrane protein complex subunit 9 n=1 Tax=Bos taurus TaxID=9913 RepID=A0AAA9TUD2_BOVIN
MGEVEISARAYVKMSLHAARYPHAAVNGLLLAPAPAPRSGECLCLTDCVPLFHSHLALSVMLEVALNQVDVWGAQAGLVVAGYYHANAALDDQSPGPLALKIAGRIAEFFPDAVLIMLDNQKLVPQPHVPPVIVLENHGLRWVPKDKNFLQGQGVGVESCLGPPPPPHVSIADLHDHQPDIPVLCLIQLVYQLPIITLWETWIRPDFKGVPPPLHPD